MKKVKTHGQMYLIAAVIIVVVIVGIVTVANYSKKENPIEIYKLGEELGIESANLLEFGAQNGFTNEQMGNLLTSFVNEYAQYGNIERLYFIFGNTTSVTFVGYHEFITENVTVYAEGDRTEDIEISPKDYTSREFSPSGAGSEIEIIVQGLRYGFTLRAGENFYFVIFQEVGGEQYVIQGGNKDFQN